MKAKEKAICEAYGEYWFEVRKFVNKDGWFDKNSLYNNQFAFKYSDFDVQMIHKEDYCIPKSLFGIEDNNGWISVNEQLPKIGDRIISRRDLCEKIIEDIETVTNEFLTWYDMNNITHWKYYISQPPIY